MTTPLLHIRLFERLRVERSDLQVVDIDAGKAQELLCYILLYRDRLHTREALADVLWENAGAHGKKALRQALWQLHNALQMHDQPPEKRTVIAEQEWVRLNPGAELWLDIAVFEQAFALVEGVPARALEKPIVQALEAAVALYRGDLLQNWYQDWCVYERKRLQDMYLIMLDKLMGYCDAHQAYEAGLTYGTRILRYDAANERTYRRMMRLHYLTGNRTAALRQYEDCVAVLREELDVEPARSTTMLYEDIRADCLGDSAAASPPLDDNARSAEPASLAEAIQRLRSFQSRMTDLEQQIQQAIQAVEVVLLRLQRS